MKTIRRNLRIGELATRTGRSVHTIRWYERQGLIPGVVRDAGGRRVYHERHVGWLELIERLRFTGMSIAQMREFTALVKHGRGSLKQQQTLLFAHRARVRETIDGWAEALRLLDRKIDFYGEWLTTGQRPRARPEASVARRMNSHARKRRAA
jgi:DNA-binding transcriptional MerR regulator